MGTYRLIALAEARIEISFCKLVTSSEIVSFKFWKSLTQDSMRLHVLCIFRFQTTIILIELVFVEALKLWDVGSFVLLYSI